MLVLAAGDVLDEDPERGHDSAAAESSTAIGASTGKLKSLFS